MVHSYMNLVWHLCNVCLHPKGETTERRDEAGHTEDFVDAIPDRCLLWGGGWEGLGRGLSAYLSVAWASCIYCLKWAVFPINVKSTVRGWEGLSEGKGMNLISEPPFCKPSVLYGNGKTGHRSALKDNFALGEGGGAKCYFCYFLISWIVESGI